MRIAESTGRSALVVLGVLLGGTVAAASWTCDRTAAPVPERASRVGKIRRCAAPAPAREARNLHVERLMSVRTPLVACMKGQQADLRLVLNIAADGTIANLEVTTKTDEVAKVDLKVLQCVNHAVSGLTFPAGNGPVKLSTHLRASP